MASSLYSNTQHIDFESVLAMDDPGMVSMFQAIMASGLEGFLGCPAVIHEAALVDFFKNASVRDGVLISTVAGQLVEISEEWFAESFDLPVDGLVDLSEIPKDVVFDARSIVSMLGEPVSLFGKKSQMKVEYRLLCDIMAKSISVKAGSFNAIKVEKFSMVTAVVCGVRMNWARVLFNILKKMVTPGSKQAKGFAVQISLLLENIPNLKFVVTASDTDEDVETMDVGAAGGDSREVTKITIGTEIKIPGVDEKTCSRCAIYFCLSFISAAKFCHLYEQVAATRNDLLDFSAQAQQTLTIITSQHSELVAYINRGGNDKKWEVVSSSRPQPPPDDQIKGSDNPGGGGDIPQRDIENAQRTILERLMSADRAREREEK
ncbi:hypothetical protein F511_39780 [Dorcoceras hygrometricum]|uniref:Dystroglycan-like n=1 Tax=Dorcoceras hygrometricum TaxID=472368 RepID=A0A2Z7BGN4_9LAMI|nr:hypothetical protein F511_39780 [Dorcoceras hygrometricum]